MKERNREKRKSGTHIRKGEMWGEYREEEKKAYGGKKR